MRRIITYTALVLLTLSLCMPTVVAAQESASQLSAIKSNCQFILQALTQLQKRDLVARTNRGRTYEAALRQTEAFVQRLENNDMLTQAFDLPVEELKLAVADFRAAYVRYDNGLNDLHGLGCQENLNEFAAQLGLTRALRAEAAAAITKADEALARYREAVVQLQQQIPVKEDA